ncbi:MAG: SprB repeat-containing protein, partial [Bacteroidetes bacterium]|nr:SprB repeat-containing protein [Bacteroidota bacterium]
MKYFTHNYQTKILLTLFLGLLSILSFGEGTKQTAPNSSDEVSLCINNTTYGRFARYGSNDVERLYVRIQNPNTEKVYLGFSRGKNSPTSYEINSYFRIVAPNGSIVYGPQLLDGSTSNITGANNAQKWAKATNGPNGIDGTTNGYNAFVFDPSGLPAGDYWVEFQRSGWGSEIYINYYDITVASGNSSIEGRVWSKRWALGLPDEDTDFNGAFYVFAPDYGSTTGDVTQNGFVNKIDFNGAGFRPWYFNVAFNSTGTGNTGNTAQDRKSVWNAFSMAPEYEVFLTNPDINVWQNGSYDDRITINEMSRCGVDESCINVDVYATGDVEVLLDFHPAGAPDGVFTAGTADRIIVQNIDTQPGELPPFSVCVPWDGLDGLANLVDVNANVPVVVTFAQAAFHFPVYDIEENQFGFSASPVRPTPPVGYQLKFYWDDSNINWNSGTGSPNVNLTGCIPSATPPGGCHTWNGFNGSNGTPQYGNRNTINTWWYANRDQASANLNMPNYIYAVGPANPIYASPSEPIQVDGSFWWANNGQYGDEVYWMTDGDGTFSENPSASCTYTPGTNDLALGYADITFIPDPDENCESPSYTFRIIFCTLDATVVTEDVSCFGASDGSITVTASNGTTPYQYSINGGTYGSSNIFSGLSAGNYFITVKDANDCTVTVNDIIITEAENDLEASIDSQTNVTCYGESDGEATASATGGTAPYTYSWNTDPIQTGTTATGLGAGTYTVTVTDDNGCTDTEDVTVTQPDELIADANVTTPIACNGGTATITITAEGGTGTYTYTFNGVTQVGDGVFSGIAAGTAYTWSVVDENDCEDSGTLDVEENDELIADANVTTPIACNGGTATVTITAE